MNKIIEKCKNFCELCINCDGVLKWKEEQKTFERIACPSWDLLNIVENENIEA